MAKKSIRFVPGNGGKERAQKRQRALSEAERLERYRPVSEGGHPLRQLRPSSRGSLRALGKYLNDAAALTKAAAVSDCVTLWLLGNCRQRCLAEMARLGFGRNQAIWRLTAECQRICAGRGEFARALDQMAHLHPEATRKELRSLVEDVDALAWKCPELYRDLMWAMTVQFRHGSGAMVEDTKAKLVRRAAGVRPGPKVKARSGRKPNLTGIKRGAKRKSDGGRY